MSLQTIDYRSFMKIGLKINGNKTKKSLVSIVFLSIFAVHLGRECTAKIDQSWK